MDQKLENDFFSTLFHILGSNRILRNFEKPLNLTVNFATCLFMDMLFDVCVKVKTKTKSNFFLINILLQNEIKPY